MKSRLLGAVAAFAIVAGVSLSANAKTLVYCSLVVAMATLSGWIYGWIA